MRALALAMLTACSVACGSVFPTVDDGSCSVEGDISIERVAWRPSCNGAKHRVECGTAYGVDEGCTKPYLRDDALCHPRPGGLDGCVPLGGYVCCPD